MGQSLTLWPQLTSALTWVKYICRSIPYISRILDFSCSNVTGRVKYILLKHIKCQFTWTQTSYYKAKNTCVLRNSYVPCGNTVWKSYFREKGQSQGHKFIDFGIIWKGILSWVCMPNMKSLSPTLQQMLKLTIDKRIDRPKTLCPWSFDPGAKIVCLRSLWTDLNFFKDP